MPSVAPLALLPENVDFVPEAVILKMAFWSVTYAFPLLSKAMPPGAVKPVANTVATPVDELIFRIWVPSAA